MNKHTTVTAYNGVPFTVSIEDDCGDEVIAFYDDRYKHTSKGQFISSYYISTVLESLEGFTLDSGVPEWCIDGIALKQALKTLNLI
jgi:hypothetical protein